MMGRASEDARIGRASAAAEWFVRVSEDDLSERELEEWLDWRKDPENQREFQRIRATSETFAAAPEEARALLAEVLALEARDDRLASGHAIRARDDALGRRERWVSRRAIGALAAVAIVAVLAIAIAHWMPSAPREIVRSEFQSGEANRSAVLPDGSAIVLAPRTRVVAEFDGHSRRLALSGGEAYFKVHHDASQPFVVHAGPIGVTAVGTAFDVRLEPERIVVTVQEGIVALDASSTHWRVEAGHQIAYDLQSRQASVRAVDAIQAVDWREGRLQYVNQPLGWVVQDVSRYVKRPIRIEDEHLSSLKFTGTVFTGAIDDWVGALSNTFPIRAETAPDGSVMLRHAVP